MKLFPTPLTLAELTTKLTARGLTLYRKHRKGSAMNAIAQGAQQIIDAWS